MIKDLDYKAVRKDVCDELGITIDQFKRSTNSSNSMVVSARLIAFKICTSYGLTDKEALHALELKRANFDKIDSLFREYSEDEFFRRTYATLKMSCMRKYRKDVKYDNY